MAEYKTTVTLEIGAQSVVMAVFTPSGRSGYTLSRYARRDILLDPVEEGMRIDYVSHAIGELVTELKLRGKDVRNVVSGQKVFMRFIKLPALDNMDDLAEQVGYEAQQHIPFPPEDIIYSYQTLESPDDAEQEVLLVAIKKDELDDLNSQVEANGLRTRSVDCSITSLYNSFRATYPDEVEPVMLLDIGAKTTDIIFSEAGRFFTRSVTAAGAFVTNSIAREFNMSFREAEQMKIEQGVISLGNGHTDSMTESEAALASVIRNAMTRLSSEVQRTINHYRAQFKGSAPVKAYICGGGARMAYTIEFLQSTLDIPVEFFNPLNAVKVSNKLAPESLEMDALCLGPVVGAAISGAGVGEFKIDLVPTSVGKDRAEKKLIPVAVAAGVIALAGAGYFALSVHSKANEAAETLRRAEPNMAKIESIHSDIEKRVREFKASEKKINEWKELYNARRTYADIIRQLSEKTANVNLWLTDFEPCINYDVKTTRLQETMQSSSSSSVLPLISSNNANAPTSAINQPIDDSGKNGVEVSAVIVKGYILKGSGKNGMTILNDLVTEKFSEKSEDSLFSFQSQDVVRDQNKFFVVQDSSVNKGNLQIPGYVDKFTLVMPLKSSVAIPELGAKPKASAASAAADDDD